MIEALAQILPFGQQILLSGFVVFLRIGAVMVFLPAFGEQMVPMRIRLALAVGFTLIVAPAVSGAVAPVTAQKSVVGLFILPEVIIGLALGVVLRLTVMALQVAGAVAAQATSLSQLLGGAATEPQPAMGQVMFVAGLALAVAAGLHVKAAQAMILSYEVLPPGRFPDAAIFVEWGLGRTAWAFGLAVTLAMPFVITSLIYNLALGVINRAMPQLMVAMVGAPAITAGGLILLFAALPLILGIWTTMLEAAFHAPFTVRP